MPERGNENTHNEDTIEEMIMKWGLVALQKKHGLGLGLDYNSEFLSEGKIRTMKYRYGYSTQELTQCRGTTYSLWFVCGGILL